MAFESGSVGFRMFYVPGGLPRDHVSRLAEHAAPPIDTLGREPIRGWVSWRHLLDRKITEDNATLAGYVFVTLMKAERKVPEALLRAECRMEELAEMQARNAQFLKREVRSEIRKNVFERLLPRMPPTLSGIQMVFDRRDDVLYASAMSDAQLDAFTVAFRQTMGKDAIPLTPESAAVKRKHVSVKDLPPTSFSPDCEDGAFASSLGLDFLTWLWFYSEARGGLLGVGEQDVAVALEGPLTFVREADGAHETILRKGTPQVSAEAKTALMSGKKLRRAKLTLVRKQDEAWTCALDAESFAVRGLKVPRGEDASDLAGRFQERMIAMREFREIVLAFYDRFLDERCDARQWAKTRREIHQWVANRAVRQ